MGDVSPRPSDATLRPMFVQQEHESTSPVAPRRRPRSSGARLLSWQARRIGQYIEEHLGQRILVSDLSGLIQRTEAHFSRAFKRTFGRSPHAYLMSRRLEWATELMVSGNAPLSDIALKCGFTDQAHLCKQFRQHRGTTPAAWRRAQEHEYPPSGG
jgi:AraC family transcriptional regulator